MSELYEVVTDPGNESQWIVRRLSDGKVMKQGSVITCLRWVEVWGPMFVDA